MLAVVLICALSGTGNAQSYTSTSSAGAWNATRWNNSADGPTYTSTYTANNPVNFTSGNYTIAGMGVAINVGNITLSNNVNVTFTATTGTLAITTGRTISVGTGSTIDFSTQPFSTTGGTGFTKSGAGVLALAGGAYTNGFRLNSGTVIVRDVNAMGSGGALTLNGGTVAANASRFLSGKYTGGITIGGNVQFGELAAVVPLASDTASLTFSDTMNLGAPLRTLTVGNNGVMGLLGVISNTGSNGITFAAASGVTGRFEITNTFSGPISITGGEVRFGSDGSFGSTGNTVINVDGGRLATFNDSIYTLLSTRGIFVGDTAGTAISVTGLSGALTYNGVIADITGKTGAWIKQGAGTLTLGGSNTYTGTTTVNAGTLALAATGAINSTPTIFVGTGATYNVSAVGGYTLGSTNAQALQGTGTVNGGVTVGSNGTIRAGDSNGVGTLSLNGPGLTIGSAGTLAVKISTTAGSSGATGSSSTGTNNNLLASLGSFTFDPAGKITIDGTGITDFTLNSPYSYKIATGAGNQSTLLINNQSAFSTIGFSADTFSVTGNAGGDIFVNFTPVPVPEPTTVLGISVAALGLGAFVRRRWKATPTHSIYSVTGYHASGRPTSFNANQTPIKPATTDPSEYRTASPSLPSCINLNVS